jgi:hypothetical protein
VGEPCLREERKATDGFLAIKRSHIMSSYQDYQDEITKASKTVQKKIAETEKKIGDTTLQVQDEFFKTCLCRDVDAVHCPNPASPTVKVTASSGRLRKPNAA